MAILQNDPIRSVVTIFASARAAGVSANLDPEAPADYLRHQLALLRPDIVVADAQTRNRCAHDGARWLTDLPAPEDEAAPPPAGGWPVLRPGDPIGINFTSGTTGLPKAVERSHRMALTGADGFGAICAIRPGDRVALFDPLSFAGGRAAAMWTLLNGASLRIFPLRRAGAAELVAWLRRHRPTFVKTTPTAFRGIVNAVGGQTLRHALEGLRILSFEGEPCRAGDVEAFRRHAPDGCLLRLTYSATEFGNAAQCFLTTDFVPDARGVPAGFVNPGYSIWQGLPRATPPSRSSAPTARPNASCTCAGPVSCGITSARRG